MGLNQLFNKDLVFCLHAKDQTDLFEQVASLLEERQIVTPTYRSALIEREKSFPTGLDMEFLGKDLPNVAIPHTDPEYVKKPAICLGVLDQPVEFCVMGMEGEKTRVSLLFMLAIKKKEDQLGLLQKLIEACQDQEVLKVLRSGSVDKIDEVLGDLID